MFTLHVFAGSERVISNPTNILRDEESIYLSRDHVFMRIFLFITMAMGSLALHAQRSINVIGYYSAGADKVAEVQAKKLTHIIYSFCHLRGNQLVVDNAADSLTIEKLVALKSVNPNLKVMLSLGGWGGCKSCSDVFSTDSARQEFANSVVLLNNGLGTDGLDLDWEYPAVEGFPGHPYKREDRHNFTELIRTLRKAMGTRYELSFAAGGFQKYLEEAVEWDSIMTYVDRVNVMSYDLVGGYATVTGHHTPLCSNRNQRESTDNAVQYLLSIGVPADKIVIGAAFYARVWENVSSENNGIYQEGKFLKGVNYRNFGSGLSGFDLYWDNEAQARYAFNPAQSLFATFDDQRSVILKTQYAINYDLNGIMFWELSLDKTKGGLLDSIHEEKVKATGAR